MFRDLFHEAYGAMRHNRRRTALTMLGMAWGIATVVMLLGLRQRLWPGLREYFCQLRHQADDRGSGPNFHASRRSKSRHAGQVHHGRCGHAHH